MDPTDDLDRLIRDMAAQTGMTERQARRALKNLQEQGLVNQQGQFIVPAAEYLGRTGQPPNPRPARGGGRQARQPEPHRDMDTYLLLWRFIVLARMSLDEQGHIMGPPIHEDNDPRDEQAFWQDLLAWMVQHQEEAEGAMALLLKQHGGTS